MKKTKIILKELAFYARHGLTEEEAKLGQRFKVDIVVELNPQATGNNDVVGDTVNYVDIYEVVQAIFEGERYNFIETCADSIASTLIDKFSSIDQATVTVKKPSVPVDCICDYFAAEVTVCR
tara:strand:+ start:3798 stop:4163 length:366 start_codon:yes stop_codon:yes gene_type:complete